MKARTGLSSTVKQHQSLVAARARKFPVGILLSNLGSSLQQLVPRRCPGSKAKCLSGPASSEHKEEDHCRAQEPEQSNYFGCTKLGLVLSGKNTQPVPRWPGREARYLGVLR